eukprot:m.165456 g.165456  ORF g.165456 m.165456 type:complete len:818 (-) comp31386_c6_seq5:351-2804(-)
MMMREGTQEKVFADDFDDGQVLEKSPGDGRWYMLIDLAPVGTKPQEADTSNLAYDSDNGHMVIWNQTTFKFNNNATRHSSRYEGVKHIENKFESLKQIDHANFIKFYAYWHNEEGKDEDENSKRQSIKNFKIVWITELMTGVTLRRYLRNSRKAKTKLPSKIWKKWCEQILSALSYMHERGLSHGNVRPSTVHVQHHGGIKIGAACINDFHQGIKTMKEGAKFADWVYLAPEEFDQTDLTTGDTTETTAEDHKRNHLKRACLVDVYAFGIIALEMITLKVPYAEYKTTKEMEQKRLDENQLPKDLDDVQILEQKNFIIVCLQSVEHRPTASELLKNNVNVLMEFPRLESLAAQETAKYVKKMEEAAKSDDHDDEEFNPLDLQTYSSFDSTKFLDEFLYDKYASWFKQSDCNSTSNETPWTISRSLVKFVPKEIRESLQPQIDDVSKTTISLPAINVVQTVVNIETLALPTTTATANATASTTTTSSNTTSTATTTNTSGSTAASTIPEAPPVVMLNVNTNTNTNMNVNVNANAKTDSDKSNNIINCNDDNCIEFDEDGSKHIEALQTLLEVAMILNINTPTKRGSKPSRKTKANIDTVEGVAEHSIMNEHNLDEQAQTTITPTGNESLIEIAVPCKQEHRRVIGNPICVVNEHQNTQVKYEINVTLQLLPLVESDGETDDTNDNIKTTNNITTNDNTTTNNSNSDGDDDDNTPSMTANANDNDDDDNDEKGDNDIRGIGNQRCMCNRNKHTTNNSNFSNNTDKTDTITNISINHNTDSNIIERSSHISIGNRNSTAVPFYHCCLSTVSLPSGRTWCC